jgi:hypothetical protein
LVTLPELASDGGFFIFMFWYFHRGLEPRLQRAHAGHTQAGSSKGGQRPSLNSGFHSRHGWPRRLAQKSMFIYITIIAAIAFWVHAERKLGLGFRILATVLLVTTITLSLHSAQRIYSFYDRGYVAEALKTMVEGEHVQDQELYRSMIERYKYGDTIGGAFLMEETRRIQDLRKGTPAEQE